MKLKNLKLLSCIIAVALAFTFVPSTVLTVLAGDAEFIDVQSETDHSYEEEPILEEPIYEETTGRYDNEIIMEPMSSVIDTGISVNAIGQGTSYQILPMGAQYIPEGVYCFENYGNDDYWASILDNSSDANGYAVQTNYTTNPASNFNRAALFKVSRVGTTNRYVIRSMLNNRIGLALVGNVVRTKELPPIDTDVALSDTFVITSSTGGYTIAPYNTTYVICAPNNTNSGTSTAKMHRDTATNAGNRAIWRLYRYTGEARGSTAIPISPTNWDNGAKVGTTYTVSMKPWTTEIDANMPYISIHPDYTDMATVERVNDYTIKVTPKKVGPLGIRTQILRSASAVYETYKSVFSVVPEVNGESTFIENRQTYNYVDLEGSSMSAGAAIQLWSLKGGDQSKWLFEVAYGGFFYIKSLHSNMYIGVDSANTSLVKQYSTQNDYTLWRFKETSAGQYTLACKATESGGTVLSASGAEIGDNLNMVTYTNNSDYKDEWIINIIEEFNYVILEGQKNSKWCWVTSARMFAKNYASNITYTQDQAVKHIKGDAVNEGGNIVEAANATRYYLSNTDTNLQGIDIVSIYEESTMQQFLNDGHVIYVSIGWYSNIYDENSRYDGHAILITGYVTINGDCRFIVEDPWPVDEGEMYTISYEKLVNGRNYQQYEKANNGVWECTMVANTSYSGSYISGYFG